jgi:hypothetical protein
MGQTAVDAIKVSRLKNVPSISCHFGLIDFDAQA